MSLYHAYQDWRQDDAPETASSLQGQLRTPRPPDPTTSQIGGFTPINIDAHGERLDSPQGIFNVETPLLKRRRVHVPNPWTPRKSSKRPRTYGNVTDSLAGDADADGKSQMDSKDSKHNETVAMQSSVLKDATSARLKGFLYHPKQFAHRILDTAQPVLMLPYVKTPPSNQQSLSRKHAIFSIPDDRSDAAGYNETTNSSGPHHEEETFEPPSNRVDVPCSSLQQAGEHHEESNDQMVAVGKSAHSAETSSGDYDMTFSPTTLGVLEPQSLISVPGTPPQRTEIALHAYASPKIPNEAWDEALELSWGFGAGPTSSAQGCAPLANFGPSVHQTADALDGPNYLLEDSDLEEIESALLSAEEQVVSSGQSYVDTSWKTGRFIDSTPPSTQYLPARSTPTSAKIGIEKVQRDEFLDDLDEHDIFDLIDAADQASAAIQAGSSSPSSIRPKLVWNMPKGHTKVPFPKRLFADKSSVNYGRGVSRESAAIRNQVAASAQKPGFLISAANTRLEDSLDAPGVATTGGAAARTQPTEQARCFDELPRSSSPAPFTRGDLPKLVRQRSAVPGLSANQPLRVSFRVTELLNAVRLAAKSDLPFSVELYAKVVSRKEVPGELQFVLGDLFFSHRPPYLDAVWRGWKGNGDRKINAEALVKGAMCRVLGRMERQLMGRNWVMVVLSAQTVSVLGRY